MLVFFINFYGFYSFFYIVYAQNAGTIYQTQHIECSGAVERFVGVRVQQVVNH